MEKIRKVARRIAGIVKNLLCGAVYLACVTAAIFVLICVLDAPSVKSEVVETALGGFLSLLALSVLAFIWNPRMRFPL